MRDTFIFLVLFSSVAPAATAQQLPEAAREQLRLFLKTQDRLDLVDATGTDLVSTYILERILAERPDRIEVAEIRQDLQGGSLSGRTGSTSIIARPSVTDLVSAAIESGAVGRKSDDKAVTFSVNALPLRQLLSGERPRGCGSFDNDCRQGAGRWLRGLSGSVSVSPSNPEKSVPVTAESETPSDVIRIGGRALQVVSVRYELFVRERDNEAAQKALDAAALALQDQASAFLKAQAPFQAALGVLLNPPPETKVRWTDDTIALLERNADSLERLEAVLLSRYEVAYEMIKGNAALQDLFAATLPATLAYVSAQNAILAEKLYRKALTFDYVHERPTDQPALHQMRLVFSTPLGRKSLALRAGAAPEQSAPTGTLTVNSGFSLFDTDTTPQRAWKVRDAQLSVGLDWSPRMGGTRRPTYTAAYYFQYMVSNGVLMFTGDAITPGGAKIELPKPAKELLDTKGAIHIGQVRASFPVGSGVSFPVALSYSNRSELIKGRSFWQGHFGVSYDLSQLKKLVASQ